MTLLLGWRGEQPAVAPCSSPDPPRWPLTGDNERALAASRVVIDASATAEEH
ncbi:MAG: hypothetical protein ACRDTD_09055 [Pseudonocardiaceae bacterium]